MLSRSMIRRLRSKRPRDSRCRYPTSGANAYYPPSHLCHHRLIPLRISSLSTVSRGIGRVHFAFPGLELFDNSGQVLGTSRFLSTVEAEVTSDTSVDDFPASSQSSVLAEIEEDRRSVEQRYARKTPLEHVLLRPGMYVGPTEKLPASSQWVLEKTTSKSRPFRIVRKDVGVVPALIKIFDEILVNASDNRLRDKKRCNRIDVIIERGNGKKVDPFISIENNGKAIPITMHKDEGMYVPEMLFGHLLTGSNFDDDHKRLTGGRHGYGAKLTNIFSKKFVVEIQDDTQTYRQEWTDNMSKASKPEIGKATKKGQDFTRISFVPDIPRLTSSSPGKTHIDDAEYGIMCRRVVDIAGCGAPGLTVTLNGKNVSLPSFQDYCNLYRNARSLPLCHKVVNGRWEVVVGLSNDGKFDGISFVNGMATTRGGTHLQPVIETVSKTIMKAVVKAHPELKDTLTTSLIRPVLFVSVKALIENPNFDSQMKEALTSAPESFGSECKLSRPFLASLTKSIEDGGPGIVEEIIRVTRGKQQAKIARQVGGANKSKKKILGIPKLEDAHLAGTVRGAKDACTLILTEGDSAKALAVAGLEVIGRDKYGVFPLRGKFLNVRQASTQKLTNNEEAKALCAILGLEFGRVYNTTRMRENLRYNHVIIMTDQDADGSHIKGLVVNFFRHFWPSLLMPPKDDAMAPSFLSSFVTPLLKARNGKDTLSFFSMAEFNKWRASLVSQDDIKKWKIKYYKGLGTNTPAEAKEYFAAFDKHCRPFSWVSDVDGDLIDMVFEKERVEDRRKWILDVYNENSTIEVDEEGNNSVSYEDFVNKEMIHFSNADNIRSLPSAIDGLKPSQRKVLYACFRRKLKSEVKVAQLSGYCAEHTSYHHGEASLQSTIVGMAQDFVGSNNINLLVPSGQFGTRLVGGSDAASARYIFTYLSPLTRYLFPPEDDLLLEYKEDDGQMIEPNYYCPIIPLLLCNGSQGIGTGWSTFIPQHNPVDVVAFIRSKLDEEQETPELAPWSCGFRGTVVKDPKKGRYLSIGVVDVVGDGYVEISELPIGVWTENYKNKLLQMQEKGDIKSFVENHTTTQVSFGVTLSPSKLESMERTGLEEAFKLISKLSITNMHAFDSQNSIRKYDSAEDIANEFLPIRRELYHDRKSVQESTMKYEATLMENKARFITAVSQGRVDLLGRKRSKEETINELQNQGFLDSDSLRKIRDENDVVKRRRPSSLVADQGSENRLSLDFDYLLNMPLSSLTSDKFQELHREAEKKEKLLTQLRNTEPDDMWKNDLDKLRDELE